MRTTVVRGELRGVPAEKMLYRTITVGSQHVPSTVKSQPFWIGVHCAQINTALSPMAIFIETMINQTRCLAGPSVRRRSVTAKLVLDQMAAVKENVPARFMALNSRMTDDHSSCGSSRA